MTFDPATREITFDTSGVGFDLGAIGKGYAVEACTAAIDWAFDALGWQEVIQSIEVSNVASQKVAERLGARNRGQGVFQPPHDKLQIDVWGQTRDQWTALRART